MDEDEKKPRGPQDPGAKARQLRQAETTGEDLDRAWRALQDALGSCLWVAAEERDRQADELRRQAAKRSQ